MYLGKSKFLFVIGSGRSGTNFLGRIIGNHPEIKMLLEDKKTFKKAVEASVHFFGDERKYKNLISTYKWLQYTTFKPYILEKSHPNLWIVEKLEREFPDAKFIGIERDVFQVVYSMLNHKGVSKWFDLLPYREYSHFLGINKGNVEGYHNLPLEAKCTIRWIAHQRRLDNLSERYPDKVFKIDYQRLCNEFEKEVKELSDFVGIDLTPYAERPKFQPLDKWKNLTEEALENIKTTLDRELANEEYYV